MDDATPEESKPKGIKPAKLTAIIIAVIIVALAGIGGGYAYWTHHEGNAYHEAVAQAETADAALTKAVGKAKDAASQYKADQLKEPKLLDKLNEQVKKAESLKGIPDDNPSEWLAWQLVSAKQANAMDADEANAQAKALDAALKAVRDSKLAKELDTAKSQLKQGIDGAGQTLRDTDGKVADNATRDGLAKAIDEANDALSKKGVTDPKTYTDAKAKLDAAVRQVTDSKAAKEQETVADLIDAGDTEVLTTVHCPGVFKNGNPCNAVVQLAEGERYEDAPRFCGRHKDENPDDYELIDGKWTKTGAAAKKADEKAAKKPAEAPVKPAEAGNAEGEGSDASKPAEAATSPLAPADARPVFDNE